MNLNDLPNVLPAQPVPRERTQALLDRRSIAAGQIKPKDLYTLADRLEQRVAEQGERTFLIYGEQTLSYFEVDARANQMAHTFYANGLRAGDVCALAMENRPAFFCTWFGLVKLGVVVAFINTQVSGRPLLHALQTTEAKALVIGEECLANVQATEGFPDLPCWLIRDPENPWTGPLPKSVDGHFDARLEKAPRTPFPRDIRARIEAQTPTLLIFTSALRACPRRRATATCAGCPRAM